MKKLIALCLSLVLLFSLAACAKSDSDTTNESIVTSVQTNASDSDNSSDADVSNNSSATDTSSTSSDDDTIDDSSNVEDSTVTTPSGDETDDGNDVDTEVETPVIPEDEEEDDEEENPSVKDEVIIPGMIFCVHDYSQSSCTEPKVCTKCGRTVKPANPHKYTAATCTAPKTCKKCGEIKGTALGHRYANATCEAPKTCSRCGDTQGSALGHSYSSATCTMPKTCSKCGGTTGKALGHKYTLGECTVCGDYSVDYCPKLYFTGDMSQITKETQQSKDITCNITVQYRSKQQIVDCTGKIKIQGSSSTRYRKKNYTLTFYEDSTYAKKKGIDVGWGAQNKYCLKANWIDKTHSRNVVTAKLAGMVQDKYGLFTTAPNNGAIDGFPVEVYINGEFHGLYTMNIPKDEWMFNMDGDNPNHIVICGDNWNDPVKFKAIPTDLNDWTVEAGPEDDATLQKVQRLVDFVLNSSDEEFKANFDQYLNLDSTLNYYVMMTYCWMPDNTGKNMLLATYDGKVWYPSLYDLDTTWGVHWTGGYEYNYSSGAVNGSGSVLWERFEKHFKKEIAARYFELRKDILDPENVMNMFREFYENIPTEILQRETEKWTRPDDPIPGFDIPQIQKYLDTVIPRLDTKFNTWK